MATLNVASSDDSEGTRREHDPQGIGVRTVEQLRVHPLRGAIFETWVVSEIVKHRTNRGLPSSTSGGGGLFFFRDRHGLEADAFLDAPSRRVIIESKAGQTITSDMLASIRRTAEALNEIGEIDSVLVYGGDASQARSDVRVLSWRDLHNNEWW